MRFRVMICRDQRFPTLLNANFVPYSGFELIRLGPDQRRANCGHSCVIPTAVVGNALVSKRVCVSAQESTDEYQQSV